MRAPLPATRNERAILRVVRPLAGALLALAAGCRESTSPAVTTSPVSEADIAAVLALNTQLAATMAQPAVISLLGVTAPFADAAATPRGLGRALVLPGGISRAYLGDSPIDPSYLGSTFIRAGTVFRRDTSRRDAPSAAVRMLMYERQAGAATANIVGWMDMADSVRANGLRVTNATVSTSGTAGVTSVRGSLVLQQQGVFGTAVFDVLSGTVGSGAGLVKVTDSLVVDSLSGDAGRSAVSMVLPAQAISLLSVRPAAPGQPTFTSRLTITIAGRTVRIDGQNTASGTALTFFSDNQLLGTSTAGAIPNLGDAARTLNGGAVSDVMRRWMNAIGRLLELTPSASDLAQSAGVYVSLLDPVIP